MRALADRMRAKIWEMALWRAVRGLTASSDQYVTFHRRPKLARDVGTWPDAGDSPGTCAVVMQGPLRHEDDFTTETLRLYRKHFPSARLYLSTWKDADPDVLHRLRDDGVNVVLADKPGKPGLFNINMQLVSALAGVQAAHADGANWILKTRTDQRLYSPNALEYLITLARTFPPGGSLRQHFRIVGVGRGTLKYVPYHLSDQSVFGQADDMLEYWSAPQLLDPKPAEWPDTLPEIYEKVPVIDLCRRASPEAYLGSSYLQRIGRELKWTLPDSWAAFRDHYCVADYEATDFFWHKTQTVNYQEFDTHYRCIDNRREFGFRDWLLLYSGALTPEQASRLNHVLDLTFMSRIEP